MLLFVSHWQDTFGHGAFYDAALHSNIDSFEKCVYLCVHVRVTCTCVCCESKSITNTNKCWVRVLHFLLALASALHCLSTKVSWHSHATSFSISLCPPSLLSRWWSITHLEELRRPEEPRDGDGVAGSFWYAAHYSRSALCQRSQ